MKTIKTGAVCAATVLTLGLMASPALAHPGGHGASMMAGLAHPLLGLDHLLAMLAVGVWAAMLASQKRVARASGLSLDDWRWCTAWHDGTGILLCRAGHTGISCSAGTDGGHWSPSARRSWASCYCWLCFAARTCSWSGLCWICYRFHCRVAGYDGPFASCRLWPWQAVPSIQVWCLDGG